MKNNYFTLLLLILCTAFSAQNNDFTNTGGDLLWSNTANWSLGVVPNTTNTGIVRLPLILESMIDTDVTIKKIQPTFSTPGDVPVAGDNTLTIDVGANAVYGIENVSNNDINLIFKGKVTINNSTTAGISNTLMRSGNGTANAITFEDGSLLTLNTPLEARNGSTGTFNFNGTFAGTGALRFNANTVSTFGSTSNNTGHEGDLVWVGQNASVIVNTAENNIFLPTDRKIQINAATGSIQVNTANVYQGNISINGDRVFTFDVNANQDNMGTITFAGGTANGTLNLDVDNSITTLNFADCSEVDWNSGTLNITGYKEGVIKFGSSNAALTAAQISQITVDGSGGSVALDANGFLVNASSLSVNDFETESLKPIAFPTLTSSKLFFNEVQNNVKVFDLSGKMVLQNNTKNQSEITVNTLTSGLYFIIFDDKKVEKFIKK